MLFYLKYSVNLFALELAVELIFH